MTGSDQRAAWLRQNVGPGAEALSTLLAALPAGEDRIALDRILAPCRWNVSWAGTCAEAISAHRRTGSPIVLCARRFSDGDWRRLWKSLAACSQPPLLVVASRDADDRVWAEVLNEGGYDVLLMPFREEEVVRTLHAALLRVQAASARAGDRSHSLARRAGDSIDW